MGHGEVYSSGAAFLQGFEYCELSQIHVVGMKWHDENGPQVLLVDIHYVWVRRSTFDELATDLGN